MVHVLGPLVGTELHQITNLDTLHLLSEFAPCRQLSQKDMQKPPEPPHPFCNGPLSHSPFAEKCICCMSTSSPILCQLSNQINSRGCHLFLLMICSHCKRGAQQPDVSLSSMYGRSLALLAAPKPCLRDLQPLPVHGAAEDVQHSWCQLRPHIFSRRSSATTVLRLTWSCCRPPGTWRATRWSRAFPFSAGLFAPTHVVD